MASTRVFQIRELAESIIRYTCSQSQLAGLQGGSTLAALTRVNQLLSSIASAEIWSTLYSGAPLVNLLPPNFDKLVDPAIANKCDLKGINLRGVTPQDLEPYMKYGWYVKALYLEKDTPAIFEMMEKADRFVVALGLNGRHFANLKSFAMSPSHFLDFAHYIKIRGGGAVKNLQIVLDGVSQGSWVEEMTTSCMHITTLKITLPPASRTGNSVPPGLIPVLGNFVKLRLLAVHIDADTICTLLPKVRNLPALEHLMLRNLDLRAPKDSPFEDLDRKETRGGQKILSLRYEGCAGEVLHTLLRLSRLLSISYDQIACSIVPLSHPGEMERVLGWVHSHHPETHTLVFEDTKKPRQNYLDSLLRRNPNPRLLLAIPSSTLCQLGGLRSLRRLILNTFGGNILIPEVLDTLAVSLSCLERCDFSPFKNHDQAGNACCGIKILDIVKFAVRCSKLQTLAVCFDARKPQDLGMDSNGIVNGKSQLTVLVFGNSLIDDAEYVAKILHNSLPNICNIAPNLIRGMHRSLVLTEAEFKLWREVREILCLK